MGLRLRREEDGERRGEVKRRMRRREKVKRMRRGGEVKKRMRKEEVRLKRGEKR